MNSKTLSLLFIIGLLVLAAVALSGCIRENEVTPSTSTPISLTNLQIITGCDQAMAKISSFHFEETINIQSRQYGETEVRLHTVAVGDVVRPDRRKVTVERKAERAGQSSSGSATVVTVGTTEHTELHQWVQLPGVLWDDILFVDPGTHVTSILKNHSALVMIGDEEIKRIACYHFECSINSSVMGVTPEDIPTEVEIWIGKEDLLARRVKLKGDIPEGEGGGLFVVMLELSRFNREVTIELPPTPTPSPISTPSPTETAMQIPTPDKE